MPALFREGLPSTRPRRAVEAILIVAFGYGAAAVIGVGLGLLAVATQATFDAPAYAWLVPLKGEGSSFTALIEYLTQFGDVVPSIWQAALLTIILMLAYGRRWWLPAVVIPLGMVLELWLQRGIGFIVDREPPPGSVGTYFSGGSARFVIIYGLSLFLFVTMWPQISRGWRVIGIVAVVLLAGGMGYTRLYLLLHWPSDVPAGWLMGTLIALSIIVATRRVIAEPALSSTLPAVSNERSGAG